MGDIVRQDITAVAQAKIQLTRSIVQMNTAFDVARRELAAATPGSPAHAQAEEKLHRLDLSKNLSFLSTYLFEGVTENSRKAFLLPEVLGGAKVDGGIPQGAVPAFETWVRSVRLALGKRDGELMVLADSSAEMERLIGALEDSKDAYESYRQQAQQARSDEVIARQVAEAEAARLDVRFRAAKLPGGGVRLEASTSEPLMTSLAPFIGPPTGELRRLLFMAADRGQHILSCSYGPVPTSDHQETYQRHAFWYRTAPENIDALLKMDTAGTLRNLGDQAFSECPTNSVDAATARQLAFDMHPVAGKAASTALQTAPAARAEPDLAGAAKPPAESAYCERQAKHLAESRRRASAMPPSYMKSVDHLEQQHKRRCG